MADLREARLLETDAARKIVDYMEGVVEKSVEALADATKDDSAHMD
jgi:hypothetical protein